MTALAPELTELSKVPGFDTAPSIDPDSISALDKMFAEKTAEKAGAEPETKPEDKPEPKPEDKTPEPKPEDKPEPKPEDKPEPKPEDKEPAPVKDAFDEIALPPYSKPKTNEQFNAVKTLAREKISSLETELAELKKSHTELSGKVSNGLPAELEAELKELRDFRNKLDVEANPEFKSYDKTVSDNVESIYARLKADGFTDAHLAKIKELGGPGEVDWDSVKMDGRLKRFVDAKLIENETLIEKKNKAVADAKSNAEEYLRNKAETQTASVQKANKEVELKVKELVPQLGWLEERKAKDGATEADKGAVDRHNKLVKESNEFLTSAISDNSPELRSLLSVGYIQLLKARSDIAAIKETSDAKIKSLEADLKKATERLEKVKGASTARLTSTPPDNSTPDSKVTDLNTKPAEAIDRLFRESMAAKG